MPGIARPGRQDSLPAFWVSGVGSSRDGRQEGEQFGFQFGGELLAQGLVASLAVAAPEKFHQRRAIKPQPAFVHGHAAAGDVPDFQTVAEGLVEAGVLGGDELVEGKALEQRGEFAFEREPFGVEARLRLAGDEVVKEWGGHRGVLE